jgi:hypothetical protein
LRIPCGIPRLNPKTIPVSFLEKTC